MLGEKRRTIPALSEQLKFKSDMRTLKDCLHSLNPNPLLEIKYLGIQSTVFRFFCLNSDQ